MEIGWDGILQEDAKGIFEMELEDVTEFADEDENCDSMVCILLYIYSSCCGLMMEWYFENENVLLVKLKIEICLKAKKLLFLSLVLGIACLICVLLYILCVL